MKKDLIKSLLQKDSLRPPISKKDSKYSHFTIYDRIDLVETENLGQSSDNKPRTNLEQSSDKAKNELRTNVDNLGQSSDKLRTQPKTQLRTQPRTNLGQIEQELRTNLGYPALVGNRRAITLYIYESCKFSRDRITQPISIQNLAIHCETTILSAQKTIQRLIKDGIITRVNFKNGRGGWTQYSLPDNIYQEILHLENTDKPRTNFGQTSDKPKTQPKTEVRTEAPSSSSFNNLKTTTTELSPEWDNFDLTPFEGIYFTKVQLRQVANLGLLSPDDVFESLINLKFDVENKIDSNKKPIRSPISLIMSTFRKGEQYRSPAYEETLLQEKRERIAKLEAQKKEAFELDFKEWMYGLTEEEVNNFPLDPLVKKIYEKFKLNHPVVVSALKEHYLNNK